MTFELLYSSSHCPVLARILLSHVSQHFSILNTWSGFLIPHHHRVMTYHPGLSWVRILLASLAWIPSYPWCFLNNISSTEIHPSPWLYIPAFPCIWSWAQDLPYNRTPLHWPLHIVQWSWIKLALPFLNKSHEFFLNIFLWPQIYHVRSSLTKVHNVCMWRQL